ncbi:SAM-dependent methyltransferase [uncultured Arcticibacterium sp.]|uniref:class I SAM-dependent methyltransferase n=1 Tax=uncultured Arcticibacterium sp. TaxID=2173042 RepID=UPI0030FC3CF8
MKTFQFSTYLVFQIILFPISFFGLVLSTIKYWALRNAVKLPVSVTNPLFNKWVLHTFKQRKDVGAVEMLSNLPEISMAGLWYMFLPAIIANRLTGYLPSFARISQREKESIYTLLASRTVFFDKIYEENLEGIEQVVLIGAGFDTRLIKYCKHKKIAAFELDSKAVLEQKKSVSQRAELDQSWINTISTDFKSLDWVKKLFLKGFQKEKKTLFLLEGYTTSADENELIQTLKEISKICSKGSQVAFDFYSMEFQEQRQESFKLKDKLLIRLNGQKLKFGIEMTAAPKVYLTNLMTYADMFLTDFVMMGDFTPTSRPLGALVLAQKH